MRFLSGPLGRPVAAVLLSVLAGVTATACSSGPRAPNVSAPLEELAEWREARDQLFAEDDEIVPVERREELLPIPYYPPDSGYRVPATLRLAERRQVAEMPTSTGTLQRMELVGNLEFTLDGDTFTLGAFVEAGTQRIDSLFVPFADLTTGNETYEAGRYLDIKPNATGVYTIDFNYAYNPNCAYSDAWVCPYPPPSNRLQVAIRAGEKAPGA